MAGIIRFWLGGRYNEAVTFRWCLQMLWRKMVDLIPEGARVPILSGPMRGRLWALSHHAYYPNLPDAGIGVRDYGYVSGRYERHTQDLIRLYVRRGDCFWDLGAHHGFFSKLAWHCGATTVVAFDGDPKSVPWIRRNVPGAIVHAEYVNADTPWGTFPSPDVLKCDIDGGESEAFLGMFTKHHLRPRVVILSTHGPVHDLFCRGILDEAGYVVATIRPDDMVVATLGMA